MERECLHILREQKEKNLRLYSEVQIRMAYHSNRIEGSHLTEEQTRQMFETHTILAEHTVLYVDDIVQTQNHFAAFDFMLEHAEEDLSMNLIKQFHAILKRGTSDERKRWFRVGDFKALPNEVGGRETVRPENVEPELRKLLKQYHALSAVKVEDIIDFHARFEAIHPFQDGNGRVGRLILFRECLKYGIMPFILDEQHKAFYYRGLQEYPREKGYLMDTCLSAQDTFVAMYPYFIGRG
ncbi:MAG: Fic family protein [Butyricicoccus sp.]|nr:Fic family protein [Butyricicoccus sp.]